MTKNYVCCAQYLRNNTSWLSFVVHKNKMIISPGIFFIISKFWFFGLLGGWMGKKWPKMTKKSVSLCISGTVHHMIEVFGTYVQNDDISSNLFHFFKILIFKVFQSSLISAKRKLWGVPHLLHMCVIFFFYKKL